MMFSFIDRPQRSRALSCWLLCLFLVASGCSLRAAQRISTDSPIGFFTNVAGRLLSSELNLELNRLQIYPTNQYTPAVHRLLQVAANLHDCTTNRTFGTASSYPYCPTLFRPIVRQTFDGTDWVLVIAGYREVIGIDLANSATAPAMISVQEAAANPGLIPSLGTPPNPVERMEPMIRGVPVIVAARKGMPNFNEFSMQTYIWISRLLEFRRTDLNGPVTRTNQMYTLVLTNTFGLEAWNSYSNPYPRNLRIVANIELTAVITNVSDTGEGTILMSNRMSQAVTTNLSAGSWSGWPALSRLSSSFLLPFGSSMNLTFTNATLIGQPPFLVPPTHLFEQNTGFPVPRFWLNMNVRLLYVLVDVDASRIIDYVNLDHWEPTSDLTGTMTLGADCSGTPSSLSNPTSQWCTNRWDGSTDLSTPPKGVLNQIAVGLGLGSPSSNGFVLDPSSRLDHDSAIDGFRFNLMGWGPVYPKDAGKIFYRSNVFYAPLAPYLPLYVHTTLQANDPLVHYTMGDLTLRSTNRASLDFLSSNPPLPNIGQLNDRYEPWGGNPFRGSSFGVGRFQLAAKDPLIFRSDIWNFPTNQSLEIAWLGQVHRGTPWQTLFLKSTNILQQTDSPTQDLITWQQWTGDAAYRPDWNGGGVMVADALSTAPNRDWNLVSRLAPLLNTNDARSLASVNQTSSEAWAALLDGMTVLTNSAPGELTAVTVSSNSPQAQAVGRALESTRNAQPNAFFSGLGEVLLTPELSIGSPWLTNAAAYGIDDTSLEIIPSQLLAKLRPDSRGFIPRPSSPNQFEIRFSGFDGYAYSVERSQDLVTWTNVGTFTPINGSFEVPAGKTSSRQFYRSFLVP
jgi:hypothetical protein